jgi:hypothetical protein
MTRAPALALAAILTSSCGAALMTLPPGPGVTASDGRSAFAQATDRCRATSTVTAEIAVSGSVSGQRVRAQIITGLEQPDRARLEAVALGQPLFIFVARGSDATLLLQRDNRVLQHGRPEAILEAITGVPLTADELRPTLTGCPMAADGETVRALGDNWRVVPDGGGAVYLQRAGRTGPWRLVAATRRDASGAGWRAEYSKIVDGLPRDIRLRSDDRRRFDLHLALSQIEVNEAIDPRAFEVQIPASAEPVTIEELRTTGPLGGVPGGSGGR